jgi:hypothetical protein
MRLLFVLALVATFLGCSMSTPEPQAVTLASGRHVKILSIGKINFSGDSPALMLKYETDIPIDNQPLLKAEADDIWEYFHADVEEAGLSTGIISANEPVRGLIVKTGKGFNFIYTRGSSGIWVRQ